MKHVFCTKLIVLLMFIVSFMASCAKHDDRDQFVGDYTLKVTGSLVVTIDGQNYSEPWNVSNANITILKAANESFVSVSGYYDCSAFVSGNSISMDPVTGTRTDDGITMQMTITHRRGSLNGDVLTFISDITGTGYYQGMSFPLSGSLYNEAIKR